MPAAHTHATGGDLLRIGQDLAGTVSARAAGGGCRGAGGGIGVSRFHVGAQRALGGGGGCAVEGSRGQGRAHREAGHARRLGRVHRLLR